MQCHAAADDTAAYICHYGWFLQNRFFELPVVVRGYGCSHPSATKGHLLPLLSFCLTFPLSSASQVYILDI